jgi:UDP-glucuronate decarboxylase
MRVLVTGGIGFIGSHLSRRLVELGHEVVAVDNSYTGSKKNVTDLMDTGKFELLSHDICLPLFTEVDAIFNLACPASPVHYQKNPVQTTKTNVLGSINMLELAKQLNIPILQASTSEVYGNPAIHPQVESYWGNVNPIGVRSCYDEGKRAAETLNSDYRRHHNVDTKIMRIFNTYGPHMAQNDGRVVSNFIVQALKGEQITMYGAGSQTRSFCYVEDLVNGMYALLRAEKEVSGPLNFGNPTETTMLDLATLVIQITGSSSRIIHEVIPKDDPDRRKPDISKTIEALGWRPTISLREGLERTVEYFKEVML